MTDSRPKLDTLKTGDPVLIFHSPYRGKYGQPTEATVTKIGTRYITATETHQVRNMARQWRMDARTQRGGSPATCTDKFVTAEQHVWEQRNDAAKAYLAEVGIEIKRDSRHTNDTSFRLTLANFLRSLRGLDPI